MGEHHAYGWVSTTRTWDRACLAAKGQHVGTVEDGRRARSSRGPTTTFPFLRAPVPTTEKACDSERSTILTIGACCKYDGRRLAVISPSSPCVDRRPSCECAAGHDSDHSEATAKFLGQGRILVLEAAAPPTAALRRGHTQTACVGARRNGFASTSPYAITASTTTVRRRRQRLRHLAVHCRPRCLNYPS